MTVATDELRHMTTKNTRCQLQDTHTEPAEQISAQVPSYLAHSLTSPTKHVFELLVVI